MVVSKLMDSTASHAAFALVIEKNKGILYKIANTYCQSLDDRNDLIQEILIQLWRAFDKYDDKFKISTWMYRISLNVAISFYRKGSKQKDEMPLNNDVVLDIRDETATGEQEENVRQLYEFIGNLNELNKAVMLLYLENETYQDIADALGMTETNVATKISRIKKKLSNQFTNKE